MPNLPNITPAAATLQDLVGDPFVVNVLPTGERGRIRLLVYTGMEAEMYLNLEEDDRQPGEYTGEPALCVDIDADDLDELIRVLVAARNEMREPLTQQQLSEGTL